MFTICKHLWSFVYRVNHECNWLLDGETGESRTRPETRICRVGGGSHIRHVCPSLILMNSGMPYCLDGAARHRWFPFVRPRSRFCPLRVPGWFHKKSGMPRRYGHSDCTCGNWKSRFGGEVVRLRGRIVYLSASKLDKLLQSAGKFPLGSSFSRGRHEIS